MLMAVEGLEAGALDADDVLERGAVNRIEELHGAVARAEAEQRFGVFRGRRSPRLAAAEAVELAFLNQLGFATYNDYRLRIRRSTVERGRPEPALPPAPEAAMPAAACPPSEPPPASVEPRSATAEVPPPDSSEPRLPSEPPDVRGQEERPPRVTKLCAEVAGAVDGFFARLRSEADRLAEARLNQAEHEALEIRDRAGREAAELMGRARLVGDAVKAAVDDLARLSEVVLRARETVRLLDGERSAHPAAT
jgi:hypothetical protein